MRRVAIAGSAKKPWRMFGGLKKARNSPQNVRTGWRTYTKFQRLISFGIFTAAMLLSTCGGQKQPQVE